VSTHWNCSPESATGRGSREDYRGALRDIYDCSPFTQPPLKVDEVGFQAADEQRLLTGREVKLAKAICCGGKERVKLYITPL